MTVQVTFIEDILAPQTWDTTDATDVVEALQNRYERFPETARLYHGQVSEDRDVTPGCEGDVDRLRTLEGPFYVVVYPGAPVLLIALVVTVVVVAAVFLLMPSVPNPSLRNTQSESPNNELSDRQNRPRPNGRIPDIFGQVRSTPDLLAVPYKVFNDHEEVEYAYSCIGRGTYEVPQSSVQDGDTPIEDIAGASVEVYGPNTSPNSGAAQLTIGTAINEPVYTTFRSNGVNGQTLRPPNANSVTGSSDIRFEHPDTIRVKSDSELEDLDTYFAAGDSLTITGATYSAASTASGVDADVSVRFNSSGVVDFETANTDAYSVGDVLTVSGAYFTYNSGVNAVDLSGDYVISGKTSSALTLQSPEDVNSDWNLLATNFTDDRTSYKTCAMDVAAGVTAIDLAGTYTVLTVGTDSMTLSNPSAVNSDWAKLDDYTDDRTTFLSPQLSTSSDKWEGPFILDQTDTTRIVCNYVAQNGLYKDDGSQQVRADVTLQLEVTPIDAAGNATGPAELSTQTVVGSATSRSTRAVTHYFEPSFVGRCRVRARRQTESDLEYQGTVVDEIKWRDLYSQAQVPDAHFGDLTTVQSVTYATAGALAVKDRKLNMLATRKIPTRVSGDEFTTTLTATKRADEILAAVCLDPKIGNRSKDELDIDNIYQTLADAEAYFGTSDAVEFSYTFDSDNLSFEETVATIASAVFCTAYREGSEIRLTFEKATEDSVLLFNHRNKMPGSETRTVRFGNDNDNDGVEFQWVDPDDDAVVTMYIPYDQSAENPREVESVGVRNRAHATLHAHRIYNKLLHQSVVTEFEATQEADLLVITDRIRVADNTRPGTLDGEVVSQTGLQLELSQEAKLEAGKSYRIFLQHTDGSVEAIDITQGTSNRHVILGQAPRATLALDDGLFARAMYQIVADDDGRQTAFLLTEKDPTGPTNSTVRAVNYDAAYYLDEGLALRMEADASGLIDRSAFNRAFEALGTHTTPVDSQRGVRTYASAGSSNAVRLSPVVATSASSPYSKSAWVRLSSATEGHILSSDAGALEEAFWVDASRRPAMRHYGTTTDTLTAPSALPLNTWTHVACTFDGAGTARLFVDGEMVAQDTSFVGRDSSEMLLAGFDGATSWVGALDQVRYYLRELTQTEVRRLYQTTK